MKRVSNYILLFITLLFIFTSQEPSYSSAVQIKGDLITVEAEGFAPIKDGNKNAARDEARRDAYRDALEKALGALVTGVTEMENYMVVRDKVFSQTQGIVKKFDIVREKAGEDGIFHMTAICQVGYAALDGVLGPAVIDAIGNPRVMVLIDERIGERRPFLSATEGSVLGVFEKAGYLLVDPDQSRALLNIDPEIAYNDPTKLMDTARTLNADVIIVGKAYGTQISGPVRRSGINIYGTRSTVQLKAVMTKSAYMLGSQVMEEIMQGVSVEDSVINGFKGGVKDISGKILKGAAPEAARSIVHKVAYALVGSGPGMPGMTVKARISGVSYKKSESILEGLREFAGKSGGVYERSYINELLEVDVVSEKNVRGVASFLSESGINVNNIDGQIIYGEVNETSTFSSGPPQVGVTVRITNVSSFKEAGAIEDDLLVMIGEGEIEAGYEDNVLELNIISGKTGREIASFLSEKGIEITKSAAQSVEGKMVKN